MTKYARFLAHGEVAYGVVEGDTVKQITLPLTKTMRSPTTPTRSTMSSCSRPWYRTRLSP